MRPIILTAVRGNWQRYKARMRDKAFLAVAKRVFARDNNTCQFCGFQATKYQSIVNLDNELSHNALENLATACSFCFLAFVLDGVGQEGTSGAYVIYLPEITQADLNHFTRALFCSMRKDVPYRGKLQSTYLSLKDRQDIVEQTFGPGTGNAAAFGQAIIDSNLSPEKLNNALVANLRLLPIRKYYQSEIEFWKETVFQEIPL